MHGAGAMSAQQTRYVMQEAAEHATVVITLKRMALAANQVLLRIAGQSMKIVDLLMQIMNVSMTIACIHVIPVIVGIVLIKNVLQQTRLQIPIIAAVVVMHAVWMIFQMQQHSHVHRELAKQLPASSPIQGNISFH
jgi:hypothetical protein